MAAKQWARNLVAELIVIFLSCAALPVVADDEEPFPLPRFSLTPLATVTGGDRLPGNIQRLDSDEIEAMQALSLNELLHRRIGSITISDTQNNPLQPELSYRGFTVSPLFGLPQGLAIYQNGTRINEAFGDTVNFDLVPEFAIRTVQLAPGSNPLYGLNALGGTIAMDMKDGFVAEGTQLEILGGSFGRLRATAQHGAAGEHSAIYVGARHFREDGWRDYSESGLSQVYSDFSYRRDRLSLGASVTLVESDLNGNGAAPVELLEMNRSAVYTHPDNTHNRLAFLQFRGDRELSGTLSLQGNAYYRRMLRDTTNGDETDVEPCDDAPEWLCGEDDEIALDTAGNRVATAAVGQPPFAVYNRSRTRSNSAGLSLQATLDSTWGQFENLLVAGLALDVATTAFGNDTEMGLLDATRSVDGAGIFLGGDVFNTRLDVENRFAGVYAVNMTTLSPRLELALSGRFNHARVIMDDRLGDALDGEHVFNRLNPAAGINWKWTGTTTLHASYSEANRVPSPAELSCADPEQPCRFPHAFVADPPLEQVVSRTVELGARGSFTSATRFHGDWFVTPFLTVNEDDIIFVSAGPVVGSGFFRNSGNTRRLGLEAGVTQQFDRFGWFAAYAFTRATFENELTILSDHNPAADTDGNIQVGRGDRLPGIPLHSAKLGLDFDILPEWSIGFESILASSRVLRGDEGNDQREVSGFAIINLQSRVGINERFELFLRIENLLDREYETFGTYGEADEVPLHEIPGNYASDPRFLGPGSPRGVWLGARARR